MIANIKPTGDGNYVLRVEEEFGSGTNLYSYDITAIAAVTGQQLRRFGFVGRDTNDKCGSTVTTAPLDFGCQVDGFHIMLYTGTWTLLGTSEF